MPTMDMTAAYDRIHELFKLGRYQPALAQCEAVLRQRPGHVPFVGLQIACMLRIGRAPEAARLLRRTLRHVTHPPHRAMLISQMVEAHSQLNAFDDAIDIARAEHKSRPGDAIVTGSYVHILTLAGRKDEAIAVARAAIANRNDQLSVKLGANFAEAALRTEHADEALEYLTAALEANPDTNPEIRAFAHTQMGHMLDRAKRFDEAMEHYNKAAELTPAVYDDAANAARVETHKRIYAADRFGALRRPPAGSPTPVFVVGMPRSGTTLTEQIIDAHPAAAGAGELHLINEAIRDLIGEDGTAEDLAPDRVDPDRLAEVAAAYRAEVARLVLPRTPRFVVDKAPSNFWHMGFIAMAFPDAKVIHCRRDPRDTCLSCYFQALHAAHSYAFNLKTCGQFYRHYRHMTDYYRTLAQDPRSGLQLLEVEYEDTVADQEAQTRRILDFLGLPFHENCLKFNESGRVARTLSNDQVRQPIYKTSTKRYERYEKHLAPLIEGLGDVLDA